MALRRIVLEGDGLLRKRSREVGEVTGRIRALVEDMWETMYDAGGVGLAAVQVGVLRRVVVIDASDRGDEEGIENGELREENGEVKGVGEGAVGLDSVSGRGMTDTREGAGEGAGGLDSVSGHGMTDCVSGRGMTGVGGGGGVGDDGNRPAGAEMKYVLINPVAVFVSDEVVSAKEGCLSVPGYSGVVERSARVRVRAMDLNGEFFEVEGEGLLGKALQHELDHLDGVLYTDIAESVEETKAE